MPALSAHEASAFVACLACDYRRSKRGCATPGKVRGWRIRVVHGYALPGSRAVSLRFSKGRAENLTARNAPSALASGATS